METGGHLDPSYSVFRAWKRITVAGQFMRLAMWHYMVEIVLSKMV